MTANEVSKMVAVLFFCLIAMFITIAVIAPAPRISRESNVPPYKVEPTTTITARP